MIEAEREALPNRMGADTDRAYRAVVPTIRTVDLDKAGVRA